MFRCVRPRRASEAEVPRTNVGGGVAIYVRECYKCKIVCKSVNGDINILKRVYLIKR